MRIIILNAVHVRTHLDSVQDYLHWACVLYLYDTSLPLRQAVAFRGAENVTEGKQKTLNKLKSIMLTDSVLKGMKIK